MKKILLSVCTSLLLTHAFSQQTAPVKSLPDPAQKLQVVEASCGQCKFGLKAKGCSLAVRINGKAYFLDGSDIDDHGDAHADDGFCNTVRKAEVQGKLVNDRFVATWFKLIPAAAGSPEKKGKGR